MADSKIEWTGSTWNPTRGCSVVSPGCHNCYAMRQAHRFSGPGGAYEGLTKLTVAGPQWTGAMRMAPQKTLEMPLRWRKPRLVFVNSMSDLFHEDISNEDIAAVFGIMAACPQHTFQVLTKRAQRMVDWFEWLTNAARGYVHGRIGLLVECATQCLGDKIVEQGWASFCQYYGEGVPQSIGDATAWPWPLPNVWLGVSVEDQRRADERLPLLCKVPAAIRFISAEPLLEHVALGLNGTLSEDIKPGYLQAAVYSNIDWVIVGGESGPGARPFDVAWARSLVTECREVDVACFVKQLGARPVTQPNGRDRGARALKLNDKKGGTMSEWPSELRVREFPATAAVEGRGPSRRRRDSDGIGIARHGSAAKDGPVSER